MSWPLCSPASRGSCTSRALGDSVLRSDRRIAGVGACDQLSGDPHSLSRDALRRRDGGASGGAASSEFPCPDVGRAAWSPSRGWIALALVVFATWRPARVMLGVSVRRRDDRAVFAQRRRHRRNRAQLLSSLPYLAATIVVLVIISARRRHDPSTIRRCRSAGRIVPIDDHPGETQRSSQDNRAGTAALPAAAAATRPRSRRNPLKVGFVYVSPIGDAGWTYPARPGTQGDGEGARRRRCRRSVVRERARRARRRRARDPRVRGGGSSSSSRRRSAT